MSQGLDVQRRIVIQARRDQVRQRPAQAFVGEQRQLARHVGADRWRQIDTEGADAGRHLRGLRQDRHTHLQKLARTRRRDGGTVLTPCRLVHLAPSTPASKEWRDDEAGIIAGLGHFLAVLVDEEVAVVVDAIDGILVLGPVAVVVGLPLMFGNRHEAGTAQLLGTTDITGKTVLVDTSVAVIVYAIDGIFVDPPVAVVVPVGVGAQGERLGLRQGIPRTVLGPLIHDRPVLDKIDRSNVQELVVTDSLPHIGTTRNTRKISVLSVAPLLGEAIRRIHAGTSVGAMFEEWSAVNEYSPARDDV